MLLRWTGREIDCILRISIPEGILREFASPTPLVLHTRKLRPGEVKRSSTGYSNLEQLEFGSKSPDPQSALFTPH